jgi:hypothetical protein
MSEVAPAAVRAEAASQTPDVRKAVTPTAAEPASITGPSFLGLNAPAPSRPGSSASLLRDSHHGPASRNLDYLLDDDDEPRGMAGKFFLILIALALALGFGYLRWRHEGLSSLWSGLTKPAARQRAETPSSTTETPASTPDAGAAAPSAPGASGGQQTASASQPAGAGPDSSAAASSSAPGTAAAPPGTPAAPPAAPAAAPDANAANAPASSTPSTAPANTPAADKPAGDDGKSAPPAAASPDESSEPTPAPQPAAKPRVATKPSAAKAFDQVTEAEKYIYGRGGMRQDCDRGLRMLRPAAEQSNPRAMISLGALYSTGVCAPRDLPTAYRWFALALRKQPDNQPLQENLQRLWSQMTLPERQLAVKLSQ